MTFGRMTFGPIVRRSSVLCLVLGMAACAGHTPPAAPRAPRGSIPAAPPQGEPRGYVGLDAASLRQALGTPVFVRKDGVSELWRYDGANCRAFFFLYDGARGKQVRHVETLPRGAASAADPACLAALRRVPSSPPKTS